MIETLLLRIAQTFLKHMCVQSKEEFKERILKRIEEINAEILFIAGKDFNSITD